MGQDNILIKLFTNAKTITTVKANIVMWRDGLNLFMDTLVSFDDDPNYFSCELHTRIIPKQISPIFPNRYSTLPFTVQTTNNIRVLINIDENVEQKLSYTTLCNSNELLI